MKCWEQIIVHNKHNATIKDYLILYDNNKHHIQSSMWQYQYSVYRQTRFHIAAVPEQSLFIIYFQQSICSIW